MSVVGPPKFHCDQLPEVNILSPRMHQMAVVVVLSSHVCAASSVQVIGVIVIRLLHFLDWAGDEAEGCGEVRLGQVW